MTGFEPAALCSQSRCATKLRYIPDDQIEQSEIQDKTDKQPHQAEPENSKISDTRSKSSSLSSSKVRHFHGQFLSVQQASETLSVSVSTITRWCETGKLPAISKPYGKKLTYQISPQALEMMAEHITKKLDAQKKSKTKDKSHSALKSPWLQSLAKGTLTGRVYSKRTIDDYERYVSLFLAKHPIVSSGNLKAELMRIPTNQCAKREHYFKAVLCFSRFLVSCDSLANDEIARIKALCPKRHLPPKRLTVDESGLANLLSACNNPLDKLIIVLLASTGIRASEFCCLKRQDIDLEKAILTVMLGKGNKTRVIGLTHMSIIAINDYLKGFPELKPKDYLFKNIHGKQLTPRGLHQRLERIGKKAEVKVCPHALRRCFVTLNAAKGRPLPILQRACGHSSIRTTEAYCRIDEQMVIEAMKTWD